MWALAAHTLVAVAVSGLRAAPRPPPRARGAVLRTATTELPEEVLALAPPNPLVLAAVPAWAPPRRQPDAFERTGMGGGDCHITARKTRDWVSSRDSRRELAEEEVETLARSSSAHGQSAGSERSWTHRLTICNGPCSHGGTMQTMPHLQWSERASVSPLPPRALDG